MDDELELLSELKKRIHDNAVYPNYSGISPYITLNVVDAIIRDEMKKRMGDSDGKRCKVDQDHN